MNLSLKYSCLALLARARLHNTTQHSTRTIFIKIYGPILVPDVPGGKYLQVYPIGCLGAVESFLENNINIIGGAISQFQLFYVNSTFP